MKNTLLLPEEKIRDFCRKWRIKELAVFGSILRDDFRPDSDIDFLVSFHEGCKPPWPQVLDLEDELVAMVKHPVDVIERRNVETSENYIKRKHILGSAETIYVER